MKRRLVTSALPYVNNVPHLGNLIQVLSADAFSRFCRLYGYETLYICATDEYGTATETKAAEEGISPKELCDRFHAIHADIYKWFNINFDIFGRTSHPIHTDVTQDIFLKLDKAGFISEKTIEQFYCLKCSKFLADRFIRGNCPNCGSPDARGDQCEACQKLLDPTDLKEPQCSICGSTPELRKTNHLYIDLPAIKEKLEAWIKSASVKGFWANNAIQMTQAWIRDGLKERAITRDLKWGIPVPKKGYEDKVFYVWFDAPIGYITMNGIMGDEIVKGKREAPKGKNAPSIKEWRDFVDYWWKSPDDVELFQFIGKDNIPFHTVIFPSSLLGSVDSENRDNWTMLHHMSSSEYLNYEGGKFSKSRGIGVFGDDVMSTGVPADVWRFYIFYNRPETSDAMFTWKDFQEKVNGELIGNFGNLVNRTLSFVTRYFDGKIPTGENDSGFWAEVTKHEKSIAEKLDRAELRDAFREVFELSSFANKYFQDNEPWKLRTENPQKAASVIRGLAYIVRDLAVLVEPYIPQSAAKIASFFGLELGNNFNWNSIGKPEGCDDVKITSEVLFTKLENEQIEALKEKFSGTQVERAMNNEQLAMSNEKKASVSPERSPEQLAEKLPFAAAVDLRVAKIEKIERHPKADKLYIETIEIAEGVTGQREERVIVSGLVPFYTEEQLLGKKVIAAYNLNAKKFRGVESKGMLLAAADTVDGADGEKVERCEVLDAGDCPTGTRLLPEDALISTASSGVDETSQQGVAHKSVISDEKCARDLSRAARPADEDATSVQAPAEIDIDTFFSYPITVKNHEVFVDGKRLCLNGQPIRTKVIPDGEVH